MERRVAGGRNGLILSMAPMPEAIFSVILSICLCHIKFPSINIPRNLVVDLVVDSCLTGILSTGT